MAKQHQQDDFLSGLKFNSVGASSSETDPTAPFRPSRQHSLATLRTFIIVFALILLASVLYWVNDSGSITHTTGRGVSPTEKPAGPPRNF